jgi:hypothetical protein
VFYSWLSNHVPMSRWSDRADDLLYDGESIEEEMAIDSATVVVTSHRVLAFTPEGDGSNFQQVDRPNVTGVSVRSGGERKFLTQAGKAAIYGFVLIVAGLLLPLDDILSGVGLPSTTGQLGIGGIMGMFQQMLSLLRNLDDFMRLIGALLLLFAIVPMGVYLWTRERALEIGVAGEDPIRVPAPETDGDAIAERLETVILPEGPSGKPDGHLGSLLG